MSTIQDGAGRSGQLGPRVRPRGARGVRRPHEARGQHLAQGKHQQPLPGQELQLAQGQ